MISRKQSRQVLDGALSCHKNYLAGSYKGYYITIDYKKPVYIVYIHATFDNLSGQAQFESFLKEYKQHTPYLSKAVAMEHTITLRIAEANPKKLVPSVLNDIIEPIIKQLLLCKYETSCSNCGNNDEVINCYEISGRHQFFCEQCIAEITQNYKEIKAMLERKYEKPPAYNYSIKKMNLK